MNERNQSNDLHSLSHTKWNCKYHVVFAPKYRRAVFYDSKRIEIGKILRELCEWKGVNIVEAEVCKDHVHMLLEIPPKMSISGFMGFLKGKSSHKGCGIDLHTFFRQDCVNIFIGSLLSQRTRSVIVRQN